MQHACSMSPASSKCSGRVARRAPYSMARVHCVVVTAGSGFGKPSKVNKKAVAVKQPGLAAPSSGSAAGSKLPRLQDPAAGPKVVVAGKSASGLVGTATDSQLKSGNWNDVLPDVDAFFTTAGKDIKAITLAAGRTLVLYRHNGIVYCSDVSSTAYQFPMIDAKIVPGEKGPSVEVPLDGTVYDLLTGKVLAWCPKSDNLLQNVFATLKRRDQPVDLPVFPTLVTSTGGLWVRL